MSRRLRSFHLTPEIPPQAQTGGTNPDHHVSPELRARSGIIPMGSTTLVLLGIILSLFFIGALSTAFAGADEDEPFFHRVLYDVAQSDPGIVLVGESVDVDVDEPSITVRWSILACGKAFVLPGSEGVHGMDSCGLPATQLHIFVDSTQSPTATYDPSQIPFSEGKRRSIQNLVQFDSDHTLDVHRARLYPFDTYFLISTIRAVSFTNETLALRRLSTIDMTSNFYVKSTDMSSSVIFPDGSNTPSRDLNLNISRPGEARAFTMLLFIVSWLLSHLAIVNAVISWLRTDSKQTFKHVVCAFAVLVALPQLRGSMPDAPGLDGVLIDAIGFFPQVCIAGLSLIFILFVLVARDLDLLDPAPNNTIETTSPATHSVRKRSALSTAQSSSIGVTAYELARLLRYMKGEYVFPPVKVPSRREMV